VKGGPFTAEAVRSQERVLSGMQAEKAVTRAIIHYNTAQHKERKTRV
jgi:hypothetical protein